MKIRFDSKALLEALAVFVLLVLLATVGAGTGWLRSFGGDVLAVVWVYLVFKSVIAAPPLPLAFAAFAVGCMVECGQYLAFTFHWHIPNRALRIVLGSTADWWDVVAYAIGFGAVVLVEWWARSHAVATEASR